MRNTRFSKVSNSPLEFKKDFLKLQDGELNNIKVKIKKAIEELFFKPAIVSIDGMEKLEQKERRR